MLLAASAPLIGYAFLVPPLVGMVLPVMLATPLVMAVVDGKDAAIRCLRALLFAVPLLVAASAYWTVPAILHLSTSIPSQLAGLSDWTWAESRASVRNALWLNAHWAWNYPEYFPYARVYDLPPLSFARFLLPAMAFTALMLATNAKRARRARRERHVRVAIVTATIVVVVIALSTGTNPPGNVVFEPLYQFPFGWLLREPARFLMLAALGYAVLTAVTVDSLTDQLLPVRSISFRYLRLPDLRPASAPIALGTMFLLGFPFYTGSFVSDIGRTLPIGFNHARATHVQMPSYWIAMAQFVNSLPVHGNLLVMPPDDFYEMPYTWYYGSDEFVIESFNRPALVPNPRGYTPASPQLVAAVNLTAQSILDRNWPQAESLVRVLDAPLILVRRDVQTPFPGHSTLSPGQLAEALTGSPNFQLIRTIGLLDLFEVRGELSGTGVAPSIATVNSRIPDLRLLSLFPRDTALVSGEQRLGASNIVQAPPLDQWTATGETSTWQTVARSGWTYRVAELTSGTVIALNAPGDYPLPGLPNYAITYATDSAEAAIKISLGGRSAISNGDFAQGSWGPVIDCHALNARQGQQDLQGTVLANGGPDGFPALELSAALDSACVTQGLDWRGGPILLSLMIRHVAGSGPRLCLWQTGPDKCASLPAIPGDKGWFAYRTPVTVDPSTTAITMYLYSDGGNGNSRTINDYANVRVVELPTLPSFALLADPAMQPMPSVHLVVVHSSFSSDWQGSNGEHVLVDGMINGWLVQNASDKFSIHYKPDTVVRIAQWTSVAISIAILIFAIWTWSARRARRISTAAKGGNEAEKS